MRTKKRKTAADRLLSQDAIEIANSYFSKNSLPSPQEIRIVRELILKKLLGLKIEERL